MSLRVRALDGFVAVAGRIIGLAGRQRAAAIQARIAERLTPVVVADTPIGTVGFLCPDPLPAYRAQTLLTKEPETIAWIDSFGSGDVLWDIGANVGSFSLYAALRQVRTFAFEPSAPNYFLLNRNIELNRMQDRVSAFCLAFSDDTRLASFHMKTTQLGGALSSFAEPVDWQGRTYTAAFQQGMIGFAIDTFVDEFQPLFPTHIKIDVDGREDKILLGATRTLKDARLKSVLIELDGGRPDYVEQAIRLLEESGLMLTQKGHALSVDGGPIREYLYLFRRAA